MKLFLVLLIAPLKIVLMIVLVAAVVLGGLFWLWRMATGCVVHRLDGDSDGSACESL